MIHYELIKNEQLRKLIQNSVSIQSLDDDAKAEFVEKVVILPQEGQMEMIALLQEEAQKVASGNYVHRKDKQALIEENLKKVVTIKNVVLKVGRTEHEKVDTVHDTQAAEDLLKTL